jgi:hypothetical protein
VSRVLRDVVRLLYNRWRPASLNPNRSTALKEGGRPLNSPLNVSPPHNKATRAFNNPSHPDFDRFPFKGAPAAWRKLLLVRATNKHVMSLIDGCWCRVHRRLSSRAVNTRLHAASLRVEIDDLVFGRTPRSTHPFRSAPTNTNNLIHIQHTSNGCRAAPKPRPFAYPNPRCVPDWAVI